MNDLYRLLRINLEIEGQLRILQVRESREATDLLIEKVDELSSLIKELYPEKCDKGAEIDVDTDKDMDTDIDTDVDNDNDNDNEKIVIEPVSIEEEITVANTEPEISVAPPAKREAVRDELRVEDVLAASEARDFSRAITLNDRYRFIFEIFQNHSDAFNTAVSRISAMSTLGEAYDYLLNDLELDPENEAVSEFLAIVANHFNIVK